MWLSKSRFVCNCHHKLFTTVARIVFLFFILVCKLPLGNVCKESPGIVSKLSPGVVYKAKNHQDLFPNCHDHQELFTNYRSEMFAKNHRELFPDCQQLLTKLFLQAVPGKVSASVAVAAWDRLQLLLRGIAVSDWLQKKTFCMWQRCRQLWRQGLFGIPTVRRKPEIVWVVTNATLFMQGHH